MLLVGGHSSRKTYAQEGDIMRVIKFKIPIYDWKITIALIESVEDASSLATILKPFRVDKNSLEKELAFVRNNSFDGGDTWRDFDRREGLIIVFRCTSKAVLYEVINHEKRHLVDRILQWARIDDLEAAAYLDGYISKQLFTKMQDLL